MWTAGQLLLAAAANLFLHLETLFVCWLRWCLLSPRWDHPLHPPHSSRPLTPTDWDEGGSISWAGPSGSFCFLTPTPQKHTFVLLCLQGLWLTDTAITPNLNVLTLLVKYIFWYSFRHTNTTNCSKRERDRKKTVCGGVCVRFYVFVFQWNRLFCKDPSGEFDLKSCYDDCD